MNLSKINRELDEHIESAENLQDHAVTRDLLKLKLTKIENLVATNTLLEEAAREAEEALSVMDLRNVNLGDDNE